MNLDSSQAWLLRINFSWESSTSPFGEAAFLYKQMENINTPKQMHWSWIKVHGSSRCGAKTVRCCKNEEVPEVASLPLSPSQSEEIEFPEDEVSPS